MTFMDFVGEDFIKLVKYEGDAVSYFLEHGKLKIFYENVIKQAWYYSEQGATLGAIYPHIIRQMYKQTNTSVSKESWKRAYNSGLNIPPEQDVMSYEETERAGNGTFMLYCKECCPELYSILSK
jgi:hypothetical protein